MATLDPVEPPVQVVSEVGMDERWAGPGMPDRERVLDAVVLDEVADLGLPHVVHVLDPYLDVPVLFGPFVGPSEAAAFADQYRTDLCYDGCEEVPEMVVAPLRPVEVHGANPPGDGGSE